MIHINDTLGSVYVTSTFILSKINTTGRLNIIGDYVSIPQMWKWYIILHKTKAIASVMYQSGENIKHEELK